MFSNDLQREAMKTDTVETLLKVSLSYVYKCNNNFTKEGYELPGIQFWAHMRSQISKPMPLRNWLSTNMDPFKYSLFSTRSARWFQSFHSELSVV